MPNNDDNDVKKPTDSKRCPKCKNMTEKEDTECPECHNILFEELPLPERLQTISNYSLAQTLLKEREYLFETIYQSEKLLHKILYCAGYCLLFSAIYGGVLGAHSGVWGSVWMALKIPLILFATLFLCVPLLFTLNIFIGSRLSFAQILTTLLVSSYLICLVLVSLTPILLLFIIYSPSIAFIHILNIIFLIVAGIIGISLLWRSMDYYTTKNHCEVPSLVMYMWSFLYAFVFFQFAWTLHIFGDLTQLPVFKQLNLEGDFYTAIFDLIKKCMGGSGD